MLDTFGMVVTAFSVTDKANQVKFFEETFLVANISSEVVFEILFLTLSSADVDFLSRELRWRTYTTEKALRTTRNIKLVGKKEFVAAALNPEYKTFVIHVASLCSTPLDAKFQISGLIAKEASIKVSAEYLDFADVFSLDLASKLPKHTKINDYAIKLVDDYQQPPYGPIYSLGPVELEILKAYIKTNLAYGFIKPFKSFAGTLIMFDRKLDGSFRLYVDYRDLNNLMIKNWYPLSLIGESLDRLRKAKQFTQLNLTNAYHQMRIRKGDK